MAVKGKKNKKPKNKQNHASDGVENNLEVVNAVEPQPEPKKKLKKKPQIESENITKDPVEGKKSKKRKQPEPESEVAVDPIDSPKKKKKKKSKSTDETNGKEDETKPTTTSPEKPKKKKKNKSKSTDETTAKEETEPTTISPEKPKKKKKNKSEVTNEVTKKDGEASDDETKEEKKLAYDHADEKKTVFCGNIEKTVNQTTVKNLFAQYGKIKTLRMRSETGNVLFSKKNKKSCNSFNAYIVFENVEDARKSVQLNGYKLNESHLRVNMANDKNRAFQSKGTIFVGNLPFDSTEKEVHDLFESCGKINYVRIIPRKGICYVCFDKGGTSIINALKLNDNDFKGRNLRVTRCESKDKQEKKKLFTRDEKTGRRIKIKVKKSHKLNDELVRGRGTKSINNPIIKKIKDSQKAKFNRYTDKDQVSKKDLFRRGGKFDKDNREINRSKMKQKKSYFGSKVDGGDGSSKKKGVKKGKINKTVKEQKVIAKKLKSAAMRVMK